jgi:NADH-quinone oxidoreductase subunit C
MVDILILVEKLKSNFQDDLELSENGQAICIKRENIIGLIKLLKEQYDFWMLADITAADYEDRYEVVYHLVDRTANLLAVKVKLVKNDAIVPSIASIWKAADPQEREVFDLMGIIFEGHGNLQRILCPEDFEGHPLQKSFKLDVVERF